MAQAALRTVLRHWRPTDAGAVTDGQLLERYVADGDKAAFELLVWRHERMVLGVCRRVLHNPDDAEDAFQATFLALVRKAHTIGRREAVASWLYRVAYRTAIRARAGAAKRAAHEKHGLDLSLVAARGDLLSEGPGWDLWPVLLEEVSHLSEKYRGPVVLCYLEGKSYEEAARQLGCPKGTVSTRLTRAREILRSQLTRRGLAVGSGMLAAMLAGSGAAAAAPAVLVDSTIRAATLFASNQAAAAGVISARALTLTEGVLRAMSVTKLKIVTAMFLMGFLGLALGSLAFQALAAEASEPQTEGTPALQTSVKQVGDVRCFVGHTAPVMRAVFSPDGRQVLSGSWDTTVRLWDVETGKELRRMEGHGDRVECVLFTPDGKGAVSCAWDGTIRVWDVESGKELRRFDFQGEPGVHVENVVLFPDGKRLLANAVDHHALLILDLETGQRIKEFADHPDHVAAVAISPDGQQVLEGNWDSKLRLWDVATGKQLREFQGHPGKVYSVAISPDGRRAISGSLEDNTVHLWDLASGQEIRRFAGHTKHVDFVAFSPDGRRALSCGPDQTVRLWHVETGTELRRHFGHTDRVDSVAFSPDGRYAVSGGWDNTVRMWRLPNPLVKANAKQTRLDLFLEPHVQHQVQIDSQVFSFWVGFFH